MTQENQDFQRKDIFNTTYQTSLEGILSFEIKSLIGRVLFNQKPSINYEGKKNLLHLGCASNRLDNFINADFFNFKNRPDWGLDLRFPLNCHDNVWDGVFTEHTLEHLYPKDAKFLLTELHRTMKPGAWLRITVPDLQQYVNYYSGQEVDEKFKQWATGCEAIRTLAQDYFHLSLWDFELLGKVLSQSGFVNIEKCSFMQGNDCLLLNDKKERAWETLYVEAQKAQHLISK